MLTRSMVWTPNEAMKQPSAHLCMSYGKQVVLSQKLAMSTDRARKRMPFLTCFPIASSRFSKAQTACKKNEARPGKIERQRAKRGITEKALERNGRREVFVLLCSFWLFYSSTAWFLLVGRLITRALLLKWSRAAFAWAGPLFFILRW